MARWCTSLLKVRKHWGQFEVPQTCTSMWFFVLMDSLCDGNVCACMRVHVLVRMAVDVEDFVYRSCCTLLVLQSEVV